MSTASIVMPRAPFFGRCIMEATRNGWERENTEEKRESDTRIKEIFETIDDYVEQA